MTSGRVAALGISAHHDEPPSGLGETALDCVMGDHSTSDQIAHLAGLHDSGAISDEEYTRAKDLVLTGPDGRRDDATQPGNSGTQRQPLSLRRGTKLVTTRRSLR